jgi:hypothetical protein
MPANFVNEGDCTKDLAGSKGQFEGCDGWIEDPQANERGRRDSGQQYVLCKTAPGRGGT